MHALYLECFAFHKENQIMFFDGSLSYPRYYPLRGHEKIKKPNIIGSVVNSDVVRLTIVFQSGRRWLSQPNTQQKVEHF